MNNSKNFSSKIEYFNQFGVVFEKGLLIKGQGESPMLWHEINTIYIRKDKEIIFNIILLFCFLLMSELLFIIEFKNIGYKIGYIVLIVICFVSIFSYKKNKYQLVIERFGQLSVVIDLEESSIKDAEKFLKEVLKQRPGLKKNINSIKYRFSKAA